MTQARARTSPPGAATEIVARQYSEWMYPKPVTDLEEDAARGNRPVLSPVHDAAFIWPEREAPERPRVLVAGCGTNQAARVAYDAPNAEVLGVDISEPSLAHEKFLAEKHGLANLTLQLCDLHDLPALDRQFDLIYCTGVLHHLAEPAAGLRALKSVLAADGVAALMVYGYYGRIGVYMMQDVFRRLGLGQDKASVELVRGTIAALPQTHPVQAYVQKVDDMSYDAGVVDSFLHPVDRAYTVEGVLNFLAAGGMQLQAWTAPQAYYLETNQSPRALKDKVNALPEREQWIVAEQLACPNKHTFLARHAEADAAAFVPDFDSAHVGDFVPVWRHGVTPKTPRPHDPTHLVLHRDRQQAGLAPDGARLARHVDGTCSVRDCWEMAQADGGTPLDWEAWVRVFFRRMWRLGFMSFRLPPPDAA